MTDDRKFKIEIYMGPSPEPWTPQTAARDGIGGSEYSAIELARHLAGWGHRVRMWTEMPPGEAGTYGGVWYEHYQGFDRDTAGDVPDVLIVWRRPHLLDRPYGCKVIFWAHDAHYDGEITPTRAANCDLWIVQGAWHRAYFCNRYPWIDPRKVVAIHPGVHVAPPLAGTVRGLRRAIYTAASDRGLEALLDIWPLVLKEEPQAELVVTGRWVPTTPERVSEQLKTTPNVYHPGMVSPGELERLLWSSSVWVYPATFFECYPVAAADAIVAGCHVVTSPLAGIWEVVHGRGTMIPGNVSRQDVRQKYADAIVERFRGGRPENRLEEISTCETHASLVLAEIECLFDTEVTSPARPDVAVVMISKDSKEQIERAITSAAPWATGAVIVVDPGSPLADVTDWKTPIRVDVFEREWQGHGEARTQALQIAYAEGYDYGIMLDSDDVLAPGSGQFPEYPTADAYDLEINECKGAVTHWRRQIFKLGRGWRYVGRAHEYSEGPDGAVVVRTRAIKYVRDKPGDRGPDKFLRDAEECAKQLAEDPTNTRAAYYLAQSYKDHGDIERAYHAYQRRADMPGGYSDEVFMSRWELARLGEQMGGPWWAVLALNLEAFQSDPRRAEPLCHLAFHYHQQGDHALAFLFARAGWELPYPEGVFLAFRDIYTWRLADLVASNAWHVGQFEIGKRAAAQAATNAPEEERPRLLKNLKAYVDREALLEKARAQNGHARPQSATPHDPESLPTPEPQHPE